MDATAPPTNTNPDNYWQASPHTSPPSYSIDKSYDNQGAGPAYLQGPPQQHIQTSQQTGPVPAYSQGPPQQYIQTSQQQTGVFVINNSQPQPPTVVIASSPRPSYAGHQVLACFVLWCCNPLFGLIAFILAIVALGSTDEAGGRQLGKASLIVSIVGIVVTAVIIAVAVGVSVSRTSSAYQCYNGRYYYNC